MNAFWYILELFVYIMIKILSPVILIEQLTLHFKRGCQYKKKKSNNHHVIVNDVSIQVPKYSSEFRCHH